MVGYQLAQAACCFGASVLHWFNLPKRPGKMTVFYKVRSWQAVALPSPKEGAVQNAGAAVFPV
jgi:hypothetical protein